MLQQPWDRLENEPARWYDRFTTYLLIGPQRTIKAAWLHHAAGTLIPHKRTLPGSWSRAASRYSWCDRARQWDDQELAGEPQLRMIRSTAARRRRLQQVQRLLDETFAYFDMLQLSQLSPENALKLLPTLRPLLGDLLYVYQKELDALPPTPESDQPAVTYWDINTWSEWAEANRIERHREETRIYEQAIADLAERFHLPAEARSYRPPLRRMDEY